MPTDRIEPIHLQPSVLGEQVSRILTDAILEGVLKGGEKLVEAELQKKFGISRSPLREAFRDLEKKGLVVIVPRKGTYVRRITQKDIEENFPVRSVLEGLAAKEAFEHLTAADRLKMRQALENMERAVETEHTKTYWEHHILFHDAFIRASGNEVLINVLQTLRMHSMWHRFSYQYYREDLKKSLTTHQELCRLFHDPQTDPTALGNRVQHHIEEAFERFLAYLDSQESTEMRKEKPA